jgi:capsular exopolysaccharide synthesis family protein
MAKTYEAMMKAEEEARKKQDDRGSSSGTQGPSTVDHGLGSSSDGLSSEEYHRLKLNLLGTNSDRKIKSILFSSPTEGEGTSTILSGFAMSLADQGEKVLLIDANSRSPSLHRTFDIGMENGLSDLLLLKSTLKEVIKGTDFKNLFVITVGTLGDGLSVSGRGLFASNSLDSHIAKLRQEMDWVLLDGPPINHFDEGLTLAGKVDGVVMVVEAEKTRWEVAQAAKQRLEDSGAKILGVVLNKRRFYIPNWVYKTL